MKTKQVTFYVAGYNMPGYLPDNEPYSHSSKQDAIESLLWTLENVFEVDDEKYLSQFKRDLAEYDLAYSPDNSYTFWVHEDCETLDADIDVNEWLDSINN